MTDEPLTPDELAAKPAPKAAYAKQTWVDHVTPLDSAHMNHLEDGVAAALPLDSGGTITVPNHAFVGGAVFAAAYDARQTIIGALNTIMGGAPVAAGVALGYPPDTALYRAAAGVVKTDGAIADGPAGTTFPSSPVDGQQYDYLAASGASVVVWRFRYVTASSKWVFVGGAPLYAEVIGQQGTASNAYVDLGTVGPTIAVPFAGDFDVELGATIITPQTGRMGVMSYAIGATAASDADAVQSVAVAQIGNFGTTVSRRKRKTLTAVTLTAKYKQDDNATNVFFQQRYIAITPVRR